MIRDSVLNDEESTSWSAAAAPPCLSGGQMTELGDGLLAITRELQERPEAKASSLSQWLTWLDDEGYDQAGFCAALQHLCQQRLSSEACRSLLTQARARAEAPQGLPEAIEHLSGQHPELLDEILELEQRRQSELERLLATAGGMKKSTEIGIGAGIYVGLVVATGSIGAGRAHYRQKAYDRMAKEAFVKATRDHFNEISGDLGKQKCQEIKNSTEKLYRLEYRMPLVKQEAEQINTYAFTCTVAIQHAHCNPSLDPKLHSRIASEIETRMMACLQPKVYLNKIKEWAIIENKIDRDINDFQKIADFDIQLRREFEASDFADAFILKLVKARDTNNGNIHGDVETKIKEGVIPEWRDFGTQHFMTKMRGLFEAKLLETQRRLLEDIKNNENKLASELRDGAIEENNFIDLDLSEASVRSMLPDMEEAGLRQAVKENMHKFFTPQLFRSEHVFQKTVDSYIAKRKQFIENDLIDREASIFGDLFKEERDLTPVEEYDRLPEYKVYRKLKSKIDRLDTDFGKFLIDKWEIKRDEIIQSVNHAAGERAKKKAEKQLAALDDYQGWVNSELEKDKDMVVNFFKTDAFKAVQDAYYEVRAAEKAIPK